MRQFLVTNLKIFSRKRAQKIQDICQIHYNNQLSLNHYNQQMSKQVSAVATLIVGLLALAEGRSEDRDMLLEANNREDVLEMVSPEMLDKIAHRLYAHQEEHLSGYERLNEADKRTKMNYLNDNYGRDRHQDDQYQQRHQQASNDINPADQLEDILRRTDQTHEMLTERRVQAESDRHYSLKEKEHQEMRRKEREHYRYEEPASEYFDQGRDVREHHQQRHYSTDRYQHYYPQNEAAKTPKKTEKQMHEDRERRFQEDLIREQKEREYQKADMERREQHKREKAIRDQLDEERKAEEDRVKAEEDRRKRRHDAKRRKREEQKREEEERLRALRQAGEEHEKEHERAQEKKQKREKKRKEQANSILDELAPTMQLETANATRNDFLPDTDFIIDARYKTHEDYTLEGSAEEEYLGIDQIPPKSFEEEHVPVIIDEKVHERIIEPRRVDHQHLRSDHSSESVVSSSSSSRRSSSFSSSSSSTSSLSGDEWLSDSQGYRTMDEAELAAHARYVKDAPHHRSSQYDIEEQIVYPAVDHRRSRYTDRNEKRSSASSSSVSSKGDDYDEYRHYLARREKETIHDVQDKYDQQIAAVHQDEEYVRDHYALLSQDRRHRAKQAEQAHDWADHQAKDAGSQAKSAEQKLQEAEARAAELEREAREAKERVALLEQQARETEERVQQIEHEWERAEHKAQQHEKNLRDQQRRAEMEQQQSIHAEKVAAEREHITQIDDSWRYQHAHPGQRHQDEHYYYSHDSEPLQQFSEIYEPVSLMKHDTSRHKDILRKRAAAEGKQYAEENPESAREAKRLAEDPEARKRFAEADPEVARKAKKAERSGRQEPVAPRQPKRAYREKEARRAVKEDPEVARKTKQAIREEPTVARKDKKAIREEEPYVPRKYKAYDEKKEKERRQEETGEWGHAQTKYPDYYSHEKYTQSELTYDQWKAEKAKSEKDAEDHEDHDFGRKHKHPKTVYPDTYTPPKVDDSDPRQYHYQTYDHYKPTESKSKNSEWLREEPKFTEQKQYHYSQHTEPEEWIVSRNLREISERGEHLAQYAEEARSLYKHHEQPLSDNLLMHLIQHDRQNEATLGSLIVEENERERALELSRMQEEQHLQDDYERSMAEITKDYQVKLRELDETYTEKRFDLDDERREIERSMDIVHDVQTGEPFSLEEPALEIDPSHRSLHNIPELALNEADDSFVVNDRHVFHLNLAHRKSRKRSDDSPVDPMTDIKRRQRQLQREKDAREAELQSEYDQRLAEFEADWQIRERELEKDKLRQTRRIIAEREHELEMEQIEAHQARKQKAKKEKVQPKPEEVEEEYDDEDEEDDANSEDLDDSDEDEESSEEYDDEDEDENFSDEEDDFDDDFVDEFEDDYEYNGDENQKQQIHDQEEDPFQGNKDMYELEWDLDFVPRSGAPPKSSNPKSEPAPKPASRKDRQPKKDRKGKKAHKNLEWEDDAQPHRSSKRHPSRLHAADRDERPISHRQHRHRNDRNYYQDDEPFEIERRHRHHHKRQNGLNLESDINEIPFIYEQYQYQDPYYSHSYLEADLNDYMPSSNAMNTRTFSDMQIKKYDPEALAHKIAKARKDGNIAEDPEAQPFHKQVHRHQTHSFNINTEKVEEDEDEEVMPAHEPEKKQEAIETKEEPVSMGLKPKQPKKIKHQVDSFDIRKEPANKEKQQTPHKVEKQKVYKHDHIVSEYLSQPQVPTQKHKEEQLSEPVVPKPVEPKPLKKQKDQVPKVDVSNPDAFKDHQDPMLIDFEKIAMKRAAKQSRFQTKEDEENPLDLEHSKFQQERKEMVDHPRHAGLEDAFKKSQEEYRQKILVKPRFEDFRIQFEGLHSSVTEKIPESTLEHDIHAKTETSDHTMADDMQSEHHHVKQHHVSELRRLQELGISRDDFFDKSVSDRSFMALPQETKNPTQDPKTQPKDLKTQKADTETVKAQEQKQQETLVKKKPVSQQQKSQQNPQKEQKSQSQTKPAPKKATPTLQQVPEPTQGSKTKSYVPTTGPSKMQVPQDEKPKQSQYQQDEEGVPQLDLVSQSKYSAQQRASEQAQASEEIPSKHHFFQGQQHHQHKFSLMDPIHPAKYDMQEQIYDEHFEMGDERQATDRKFGGEELYPVFDPAIHMPKSTQSQYTSPYLAQAYTPYQQSSYPQQSQAYPQQPQAYPQQQMQPQQYYPQQKPIQQPMMYPQQQPQQRQKQQQPMYIQQQLQQPQMGYLPVTAQQPKTSMQYGAPQTPPSYYSAPQTQPRTYAAAPQPQYQPQMQQPYGGQQQQQQQPKYEQHQMPVQSQIYPQTPHVSSYGSSSSAPPSVSSSSTSYPYQQSQMQQPQVRQQEPQVLGESAPQSTMKTTAMVTQQQAYQPVATQQKAPQTQTQSSYKSEQKPSVYTTTLPVTQQKVTPQSPQQAPVMTQSTQQPYQTTPSYSMPSTPQSSFPDFGDITVTRVMKNGAFDDVRDSYDSHHDSRNGDFQETMSGNAYGGHPVIVVDTDPHAQVAHEGGAYVVADEHEEHHLSEDIVHGLGQISSWFADHSYFFDSKNDLHAAREANKYLQ